MGGLTLTTVIARNNGLIDEVIDKETVALNIQTGVCYGLNSVGSRIWRLVAKPITIAELCSILQNEYTVEVADCQRQVLELLEELRIEGLVISCSGDGSGGSAI